ncbi:MAG TPA: DUF3068 domain-containing protein [Phycicoccus sp.]|nr:DUF3068 domain-containing protein [Phycicoccus sp.]HRA44486.1 DUF3068 domain-containing protein [Phycicoccus sp.]
MRRIVGLVLLGLASFLLVTAAMAQFYAPGKLKVTPLNVDSVTSLDGTATYLGKGPGDVQATSRTVAMGAESDSDVIVFTNTTCVVWDQGDVPSCVEASDDRLVTASSDSFATDRKTGLAVNDPKYVNDGVTREGLVNKWPFDVEQRTYPYWDGVLDQAVDATFAGEEELEGLNTYKFHVDVPATTAEIAKGVKGTYSTDKMIWVDPTTGSILKQTEHQKRALPDGSTVADLKLAFTPEQVSQSVSDAKSNGSRLSLIGNAPWLLGLLGLLALVGGAIALLGARRAEPEVAYADDNTMFDDFGDDTRRRGDLHS